MLPKSDQILPSYFLIRELGEGGMGVARIQGEAGISGTTK
jgi:hypothetical protein